MHEQKQDARRDADSGGDAIVRSVMVCSVLLLIVLAAGGYFMQGWVFAQSLLIGGLLVNGSFWMMQRDISQLLRRVSNMGGDAGGSIGKIRFLLKALARLAVLGLLLFALVSWIPIDAVGLIVGCTTVMVSVVIVGLSAKSRWLPDKM